MKTGKESKKKEMTIYEKIDENLISSTRSIRSKTWRNHVESSGKSAQCLQEVFKECKVNEVIKIIAINRYMR